MGRKRQVYTSRKFALRIAVFELVVKFYENKIQDIAGFMQTVIEFQLMQIRKAKTVPSYKTRMRSDRNQ